MGLLSPRGNANTSHKHSKNIPPHPKVRRVWSVDKDHRDQENIRKQLLSVQSKLDLRKGDANSPVESVKIPKLNGLQELQRVPESILSPGPTPRRVLAQIAKLYTMDQVVDVDSLRNEVTQLQNELADMQESAATAAALGQALLEKNVSLTKELDQFYKNDAVVQRELSRVQQQTEYYERENGDLQAAVTALDGDAKAMKSKIVSLQNEKEALEKQGNDLVDQLTKMEKQNKKYANDQAAIEKLKEKKSRFCCSN